MSKKVKFGLIVLLILIIIAFILGIVAIYRFTLIQSIFKKVDENIAINNYYLKTIVTDGNNNFETEAFYRDGIGKCVTSNGLYSWVDGKNAYLVDEENKKIYVLDINDENAITLVSNDMFSSVIPGYNKNIFQRFLLACDLKTRIKSDKLEKQECYMITTNENNIIKTVWIDKESKNPIRAELGNKNESLLKYNYELKFNSTNLEDIILPNIKDYTILDYKSGEIILDNSNIDTNLVDINSISKV